MSDTAITAIKGVGEKTAELFHRLGIGTVGELLRYYPRAYNHFDAPVSVSELKEDTVGVVSGVLVKAPDVMRFKNIQVSASSLKDESGAVALTWYNAPYLRATLKPGTHYVCRGRVVKKRGRMTMEQPELFSLQEYGRLMEGLHPVYGQTKGLGNKTIERAVSQALKSRQMERDYLPDSIRRAHELAEYNYALEHIHFPRDEKELLFARKRLVFDEFFLFLLAVRRMREKKENKTSAYIMKRSGESDRLLHKLPYELTGAQKRALGEVFADLESGKIMNRLIQGDVGSGKTIIAVLALLRAAENGFQGALMVPTEVLARQHYEAVAELLAAHGIGRRAVLLTGSMTKREKLKVCEAIENHEADIVIGTHALIQERVIYDRLALVITDEQHRFGVSQRQMLGGKGQEPHVLVMSATPIPRTLAIILYGDLDISVIDELPSSRLPIKNCVVGVGYRKRAYEFIAREVETGHQAYVICPMVEASDMIEAENVLDYTKELKKSLPASVTVEYLHGRMKPKEKNSVMERFAAGEIDVLVSTTVIEVGINVPNATVMMIENAERFGLAQLHQLRGRVGRGNFQSYCIMVTGSGKKETMERLDILNRSNDGFYIASEDLKLRGPGDIFGVRQSGDMEFQLADIFTDAAVLKAASEEADKFLKTDPEFQLEDHRALGARLDNYLKKSYEKLLL